jgi:glyoxylase-like metal-dependent hydrolase (beta-lactamase superfamily II)
MTTQIQTIDLNGVNAYLISTQTGFILVDTGGYLLMDKVITDRRAALQQALDSAGVTPASLKLVIATHGDCDHTASCAYLRGKYGVKIAMHPADGEIVTHPGTDKYGRSKFRSPLYTLVGKLFKAKFKARYAQIFAALEPFIPDLYIDEGFDLSAYGLDARVIHLPGHTAGSIGILTADGGLVCGDTLANQKKPGVAMNAVDFDALKASVEKIKRLPVKQVYPGHGAPFAIESL